MDHCFGTFGFAAGAVGNSSRTRDCRGKLSGVSVCTCKCQGFVGGNHCTSGCVLVTAGGDNCHNIWRLSARDFPSLLQMSGSWPHALLICSVPREIAHSLIEASFGDKPRNPRLCVWRQIATSTPQKPSPPKQRPPSEHNQFIALDFPQLRARAGCVCT